MSQNFLADYMAFNQGNEAPKNYHHWCALSALSTIISRRVWVEFDYFRIYPNLYIVLVGPAGNRKTTAMVCAKSLVRELGDIPFSAECQTKESICKEWQEQRKEFPQGDGQAPLIYTPYSIFVTELSQFIGVDPARMIDFLTTVYDQDYYDLKTKNKGNQFIAGPYITLLACTTQEWITSYLRLDIISGGFSRRCVFVNENWDDSNRIAFPEVTQEMRDAWKRVIDYGHRLKCVSGPFRWEPDAKAYYKTWYETRSITKEPTISGFDRTRYNQVIKVAMLLALCKGFDLVITKEVLETAMATVDLVMVNLPQVFTGMGRNDLNAVRATAKNILAQGPMPERKLISILYSHAKQGDILEVFRVMQDCGEIKRFEEVLKNADGEPLKDENGIQKIRRWYALNTKNAVADIATAYRLYKNEL